MKKACFFLVFALKSMQYGKKLDSKLKNSLVYDTQYFSYHN